MELSPVFPVRTRRLLLRPLTLADAESMVAYRGRPDVCRYVPFEPMGVADVTARIEGIWSGTAIAAAGEGLTLGVELAAQRRVIGDVVLFLRSVEDRGGEIGWVLDPAFSGHGYATEAAHAMLHLAFDRLGVHRMVARVDARNDPSIRLATRLGMRREAHLIENEWFKGAWSDELGFALLEQEWAAQHTGAPCPWPLA